MPNSVVKTLTVNGTTYDLKDIDSESYAPKASPALTGTPTAPTASSGTNSTQIATTAFVQGAVSSAVGNVNSFEVSVVQSLPTTNIDTHTIYFISNSGSTGNIYDEYMYINNNWEKIGTTDVDLSGYLAKNNTIAFTPSGDYNPATKKYVDDTAKPKDLMVNITSTWDEDTQSNILTADKTFTEVMTAIENGTLVYFTDEYSEGLPFTTQAYAVGPDYINLDSVNLNRTYVYNSDGTIQELPYTPFLLRPELQNIIGGSDAEAGELTKIYSPAKYSHSKGDLIWLLPDIGTSAFPYLVIDDINAGDNLDSLNVQRIYLWDYLKDGSTFSITVTSTTENDVTTYSADKTFAEITEAYESGKNCVVIKQTSIYVLSLMASTGCCFTNTYANNNFNRTAYETIRISSSDDITVYNKPFLTTEGTHNVYSNKKLIASVNGNFNTTPVTGSLTYSTTAYKAYDKDDLFWKDNTTLAKATTDIASGGTLTENTNYVSTTISDELKDIRASHLSKTNTISYTPTANYHPATKKYVDDATAGITSSLSGLTDTTISSPTNGQVLMYNSTSGKWENTSLPIYNGGVSS